MPRRAGHGPSERNRIVFSGHAGFVGLALRTGVPVVPVVAYGSHQAVVVLSRGQRVAHALGLNRLRIKVFPIVLGPFGVSSILTPPLPMPVAVTVEFMAPLDWSALGPDAADDEAVVRACCEGITSAMQATLDRLHAENLHPVAAWLVAPVSRRRCAHGDRFDGVVWSVPGRGVVRPGVSNGGVLSGWPRYLRWLG